MVKSGVECATTEGEYNFGKQQSVKACASRCALKPGCKYFIVGTGSKLGSCYQESVDSDDCGPDGYEVDSYNLYSVTSSGTFMCLCHMNTIAKFHGGFPKHGCAVAVAQFAPSERTG